MNKVLLPSLLSADFSELGEELKRIEQAGITHLHLDIMDGHFVPNISFGPSLIESLRPLTNLFFDCHLMVQEPDFLLDSLQRAGCNLVTIQQEAVTHMHRQLKQIQKYGFQVGVSLNPATPPEVLEYVMDDIDLILIMSVNPGFGGQSFIPAMMDKIRRVRQMIDASHREILLEVDGGVNTSNIQEIAEAGCDWIVAGSAVFSRGKTTQNAKKLLQILDGDQL